ncbi:MAG: ABC transporter permease [Roseinatronobacter sp.]
MSLQTRLVDLAIKVGFLLLMAGLLVFFSVAPPGFVSPHSTVFVFQSVAITGILALGVTATLVVGGFDLSIGAVATSALMLSAYVMVVWALSAGVAIVLCLLMGAGVGLVNGLLIGECPTFCVSVIWSVFPERSTDDDDIKRMTGRVVEGLQAA